MPWRAPRALGFLLWAIRVLFIRHGPSPGSAVEARCFSSTFRFVKYIICLPLENFSGSPGVRNGVLALARRTFYLKMMLPPQRGAHFPHLVGHEHHLGPSKLSSRCCAVRFLKNELSLLRGALFYTNVVGAPGPPGRASLDVRRCSGCCVVHFLIQNGALASARCSFAYLAGQ